MTELLIQNKNNIKIIGLTENGELTEYYEETDSDIRKEGNIYIGIVRNIVKGMQSAFIDIGTEKNSLIHLKDILPKVDETKEKLDETISISDIIKPGQKILVQVKKDSNADKGARVSTHINLPSKYVALMPNTNIITVSQKIEDKKEQERLKEIVKKNLSNGNGAIIRTSAKGKEKEIIEDIKFIEEKWNKIIETNVNSEIIKPQIVYKSENIIEKMLIDMSSKKIDKIIVNNNETLTEIENLKNNITEYKNIKVELNENIFDMLEIKKQIKKIQNRKIWLKCGGFITIDKTEALTAIDVNTGKYTGGKNLEQTVYKVNEEATIEIAKQLRLRDIGGIIIIDYIDMKQKSNREKIESILKEELKKDRSKTQVEGFTKLDLMELTRKHICSHNA